MVGYPFTYGAKWGKNYISCEIYQWKIRFPLIPSTKWANIIYLKFIIIKQNDNSWKKKNKIVFKIK